MDMTNIKWSHFTNEDQPSFIRNVEHIKINIVKNSAKIATTFVLVLPVLHQNSTRNITLSEL